MRSKTILSAVAFVLAFAASAAFASLFITKPQTESVFVSMGNHKSTSCFKERNRSATADKIAALIRADRNNGRERSRKNYTSGNSVRPPYASPEFSDFAEAVEQYVDDSSSMRVSDLPSDFQLEWREHMKAWRDYSKFLNKMKDASNRKNWSDEELDEIADSRNSDISSTWQEVLQSGRSYGANVY